MLKCFWPPVLRLSLTGEQRCTKSVPASAFLIGRKDTDLKKIRNHVTTVRTLKLHDWCRHHSSNADFGRKLALTHANTRPPAAPTATPDSRLPPSTKMIGVQTSIAPDSDQMRRRRERAGCQIKHRGCQICPPLVRTNRLQRDLPTNAAGRPSQ